MKTFNASVYVHIQDCFNFFKNWVLIHKLSEFDNIQVITFEGDDGTLPEYELWTVGNYYNNLQDELLNSYGVGNLQGVV